MKVTHNFRRENENLLRQKFGTLFEHSFNITIAKNEYGNGWYKDTSSLKYTEFVLNHWKRCDHLWSSTTNKMLAMARARVQVNEVWIDSLLHIVSKYLCLSHEHIHTHKQARKAIVKAHQHRLKTLYTKCERLIHDFGCACFRL